MLCYVSNCTYRHTMKKHAPHRLVKTELTPGLLVPCLVNHSYIEVIIGHSSQKAANEVI